MNKLAHGGTGNGLAVFAVSFESFAEIVNHWVMFPGAQGWHIQHLAQDRIAVFGDAGFTCPLPRFAQGGRKTNKGNHLFGVGKALMWAQNNEQMGNRCCTDTWNGFEQFAAFIKIGVVADQIVDSLTNGLDFIFHGFEQGVDTRRA